jgi:hypothetical protein
MFQHLQPRIELQSLQLCCQLAGMPAQRNRAASPIKSKRHLRGEKPLLAGLIGHTLPLSVKKHFDFGCRS